MRQFTLNLDVTQQRQVAALKNNFTAFLDTGVYIPVWTEEGDIVRNLRMIDRNGKVHVLCGNE